MHEKLAVLKEKLEQLHTLLDDAEFPYEDLSSWSNPLFPYLQTQDLIYFPYDLASKLGKHKKYIPTEDDINLIDAMIATVVKIIDNVSYIYSSSTSTASQAINAYLLSMYYVSDGVNNIFSFEVLANRELLPKRTLNRLAYYDDKLAEIKEKAGDIDMKISTINEAYDAAEGLPTTLKNLRNTNDEIEKVNGDSKVVFEQINKLNNSSKDIYKIINITATEALELSATMKETVEGYLKGYKEEAEAYINKCEEAFRTTTSKGLAGAFQDKAQKLNRSIQFWVAGLVGALLAGALVGYYRLSALESYLSNPDLSGLKLIIQLILSIFSVGAPLWFAWLATKQIGQRFRLAEDYEFKASVSKAYEGYRREAMQLEGDDFMQRLFGNALTRLEEPPLRFVEESAHSSPLMELLSSDKFKDLLSRGDESLDAVLTKAGWKRDKTKDNVPQETVLKKEVDNNISDIDSDKE
ncbi:hypothetical protein SAMN05428971_3306 [Candidatus Pantoea varia]|uniref:Uncharacterized protein n=1 Tax=Candidatus Pantoea varia TaxID=1881036 RepID=A0A1I5FLB1_9GAMM|nr:hypothetical protein [Pantoea varia]SFO24560.1 hypothetical protein SAMN05428971_3306 [Pantoea varia]